MPTSLKVLIVEDSHAAAEHLVAELRGAGFEPEWQRVDTEAEYLARLQDGLNLVLANNELPHFSGLRALELLKEGGLEIPLILVSGVIGEDSAVSAMKHGATDFLIKSRLDRLGKSVSQALEARRLHGERRENEQLLLLQSTAMATADDGIVITDAQGMIRWVNPAFTTQSGYTTIDATGQTPRFLKSGLHEPKFYENLWRTILAGKTWRGCITNRRKDGVAYFSENTITPVRSKAGVVTHFVAVMNDVTARRDAAEALRVSEERFREMAATIRDVFWNITSGDGQQIHYVSPAYEHIWGQPLATLHARPNSWVEAVADEDRDMVLAAQAQLANGVEYCIEYRINRPDGTIRWIEGRGYPVRGPDGTMARAVGISTDITERKRLTEQLLQAQKMEAIGQLAGGIAHDFNNSLTVITGYARLILDSGELSEAMTEQLQQVFAAGMRAGNLTRQLLLFSRTHAMNKQVIDFNASITELVKMLGRLIGEHIRLEVNLAPTLPALNADAGMMEQILMNLTLNARDAMPDGGVLTIDTQTVVFGDAKEAGHPERRPGEFICLTISDTGCGITPENLARIFEPFYTTKAPGSGTGLGLATVFGIVQEHGGWLEVDSRPGVGSRFRVLLPPCRNQPLSVAMPDEISPGQGSETILLVEDETIVRDFIVTVLTHYGYRVLQADSGVKALEVWKWHSKRIALLLTDMVMPDGVSGLELAERLGTEKPGLKVILMSGYTSETVGKLYNRQKSTRFIQKPFAPKALAKIVREALEESAIEARLSVPPFRP